MELQEEVTALKSEIEMFKSAVESLQAEKLAIDQMLVESLKSSLENKKNVILKDEQVKKINIEMEKLKKEIQDLKDKSNVLVAEVAC